MRQHFEDEYNDKIHFLFTRKGEEAWSKEFERVKALYATQGIAITDDALEDELTADMAGALVEQRDVFLDYLEGKKHNKTFIEKVRDILQELAAFFNGVGDDEREKQILGMVDSLNNLIADAEASEEQSAKAESAENTEAKLSVRSDVADILNDYDNDGVKYGSMLDVADGIEAVIAESTEDTTKLENILNDFRVAQDDARRWGNRMDSGGEEEFEEALRAYASQSEATVGEDYRYSLRETDPVVLEQLNNGETIKVYRAMQVIDGKLYPPMSAKVDGKLREPIELGVWEKAEERPDLADDKGYFKLDKGNSTSLKARYNPYIHTSLTPLNDQFSSAQDRPNLVTVEVEVPVSELTSGYKADKAKDAVGKIEWKAGIVQSQLSGTRTVILSRWDRPLRIVPESEVAQHIVEMFGDTKVVMPSNVVTTSLRAELEKLGVPFKETDNQGKAKKMKGTADRNASEFKQPTSAKRSPFLSRFGAKLRKDFESAIDEIENLINLKGRLSSHEFLNELDQAISEDPKIERNKSDYIHIGDGVTIRISDHYSNTKSFADNDNRRENYGIVMRAEQDRKKSIFYRFPDVDYVEYVYFPDETDASRQLDILEGVKRFIKTKDFANLPVPDNTHTSGKAHYSLRELDAPYLDAVERGDMETAQRMVLEAAKRAMPNTKVVDENGNPRVVYHGTPNDFNVFGSDISKKREWTYGDTYYFTDSEPTAATYGRRVVPVFLNISNPYEYDFEGRHWRNEKDGVSMGPTTDELTQKARAGGYDGNIHKNVVDSGGNKWVVGENGKPRREYDPETFNPHTGYVTFEPNQIKSADPVTYDDNGNVIPLSERFNPEREDIRYSVRQPIFYSNAEYAVRGIKQEKATPEQWLKMIEKNGGLKAGEDKWLGLSDWLKALDKKTLAKDEVLQYIAENDIQIEEVSYADVADISREEIYDSDEFTALRASLTEYDDDGNPYINRERYEEIRSESYDFVDGFSIDYWGEDIEVDSPAAAASYLGLTKADKEINETRLQYTTDGLTNKREIALVVPTIEPWNTSDDIHFGDAGEGRAVAWIRFGEAEAPKTVPMVQRVDEFEAPYTDVNGKEVYRPKDSSRYTGDFVVYGKLKSGEYAYVVYIKDKQIPVAHNSLEEARNAMNEYYAANPRMVTRYEKVLVIDEIQSKRHQEGREKGYISGDIKAGRAAAKARLREAYDAAQDYTETLKDKYNWEYIEANSFSERVQKFNALLTPEEIAERQRLDDEKRRADEEWEQYDREIGAVPSAPFEKNWAELAMKRMLRYGAENDFDKVAWTTGDQQAERYDIGSVVSRIVSYTEGDVTNVSVKLLNNEALDLLVDADGKVVKSNRDTGAETLADVVGKELATKVLNNEGEDVTIWDGKDIPAKQISGDGLRIGGEGMKGFYDQMLPSFVRKYAKKWGATVGEVTMPDLEENNTMHAVDVTPAMRESVMQGQPKFSLRTINELQGALDLFDKTSDIAPFVNTVKDISEGVGGNDYLRNIVLDYDEFGEEYFVDGIRRLLESVGGAPTPYTAGGVRYSMRTYDGDYKRILDDTSKIVSTYFIPSDIVVAT